MRLRLRTRASRCPADPNAHFFLGLALRESEELDGAPNAMETVIRLDPSNPHAPFYLGQVQLARHELWAAEQAFRSATDYPNWRAKAQVRLGDICRTTGRPSEAVAFNLRRRRFYSRRSVLFVE